MADSSTPTPEADAPDLAALEAAELDRAERFVAVPLLRQWYFSEHVIRSLIARARRADELEAENARLLRALDAVDADLIAIAEWVAQWCGPEHGRCQACGVNLDHADDCRWVKAQKVLGR